MTANVSVRVTVNSSTLCVKVFGSYAIPLCIVATHFDSLNLRGLCSYTRSLETADVVYHLEIVGVKITVNIRLDVAAMLSVVLVNHGNLIGMLISLPIGVVSNSHHLPFVPTRKEDDIGVSVERSFPLLLEIVAVFIRILCQKVEAVSLGIASSVSTLIVKVRAESILICILRHANRHNFARAVFSLAVLKLREDFKPRPVVGTGGACAVSGHTGTVGKEFSYFIYNLCVTLAHAVAGERFGVRHNHRLSVKHKPKVAVFTLAVEVLIQNAEHIVSKAHRTEVEHKRKLRYVDSLFLCLVESLKYRFVRVLPKKVTVCTVKHNKVNARICKHYSMLSDYVFIRVKIIAVKRLIPMRLNRFFAPRRMVHVVFSGRIF